MRRLATELSETGQRLHGRGLEPTALTMFDQGETTPFHVDGGPNESLLMLGYEPTWRASLLRVACLPTCAAQAGMSTRNFVEAYHGAMSRWFVVLGLGLLLGAGAVGCRSEADAGETGEPTGTGGERARDEDREGGYDDSGDGCAAADCAEPEHPVDMVDPDDPRLDADPQLCQLDSDCMVGTPRNCCVSFCGDDAVAWSHTEWQRYQEECAVEECASTESLACEPEAQPDTPPTARCLRERCVLR